jgi:rubrerythrin
MDDDEKDEKTTPKIYGWVLENEEYNPTNDPNEENIYCPLCGFQIKVCPNCGAEFAKNI